MTLIPVIDLLRGQVVRGVGGNRETYRPIESALCRSSDPVTVAEVLVDHCASDALYVADLDALTGGAPQREVLRRVLDALPGIALWLDAGFVDAGAAAELSGALAPHAARVLPIFGSESLPTPAALRACHDRFGADGAVLSLDRRGSERLDAAGCWEAPSLWPRRVIVMTLERVGSDAGPDLQTLAALRETSPSTLLIGAGGVRNAGDLAAARDAGAAGWLVASALHDLRLPRVAR